MSNEVASEDESIEAWKDDNEEVIPPWEGSTSSKIDYVLTESDNMECKSNNDSNGEKRVVLNGERRVLSCESLATSVVCFHLYGFESHLIDEN